MTPAQTSISLASPARNPASELLPVQQQQTDTRESLFQLRVQRKLSVGAADDPLEKEADHIADKVMRMPNPEPISFSTSKNVIDRKCSECEKEEELQRKESNGETASAPPIVQDVLSSSGRPLDTDARSFLEPRFNYNFSDVRIHDNDLAAKSASSINALAYTSGNNIVFNSGQYNTNSDSGKRLLAHELTHVVQQGGGIAPLVQKLDHTADTGFRYSPPAGVTRSIIEIQAIVGTNPDGVYGINTKIAVERYQTRLAAIGLYTDTIDGKWGTNTDVAHEAYATGPGPERQSYNCAGFAFKRYTFIDLAPTNAIYAGMTQLSSCTDPCSPWYHKFWMWEFDIFTEDTVSGARTGTTHDFHTVGGQTDGSGAGPGQVMSKDGPRPIVGPGTPMSFKPLAREAVVQIDGSRHPSLVWNVSNIDQKCFCNQNLP